MFDEIFNTQDMIKMQEILKKQKETITAAESCTGGLISSMITEVSGSSLIFNGAIISYSNEVKMNELGVKKQNIIDFGAVSKEVVNDMLKGAIKKFNADYAVAVSGVAGPTGGKKDKPVGTVVIGAMTKKGTVNTELLYLKGNRKEIQVQAAKLALKKVFKFIKKSLDK